jgi:hypothetical protein
MYLKIHENPHGAVVALCDASLIGRVLADGKRRLDLAGYAGFYQGEKVSGQEAAAALKGAANANIVGAKSLAAARAAGLDTKGAISIGGVPHLQLYRL